jgi:hypothetical protein
VVAVRGGQAGSVPVRPGGSGTSSWGRMISVDHQALARCKCHFSPIVVVCDLSFTMPSSGVAGWLCAAVAHFWSFAETHELVPLSLFGWMLPAPHLRLPTQLRSFRIVWRGGWMITIALTIMTAAAYWSGDKKAIP